MNELINTIKSVYNDDKVRTIDIVYNDNDFDYTIKYNHYVTVNDLRINISLYSACGCYMVTVINCDNKPILNQFMINSITPFNQIVTFIKVVCDTYYY